MHIVSVSLCILLTVSICHSDKYWNELAVGKFVHGQDTFLYPRTAGEALELGWKTQDIECTGNKTYQGYLHTVGGPEEPVALIYDEHGYIAGTQVRISQSDGEKIGVPSPAQMPPFVKDPVLPIYYIVIYFVEPTRICNGGRTAAEFEAEGTGTDLIVQNGDQLLRVPRHETNMAQPWVLGKCHLSLGTHHFYGLSENMSRDTLFPVVPLYNGFDLTGFGIAYSGSIDNEAYVHKKPKNLMKNPIPSVFEQEDSTISIFYIVFQSPRGMFLNFC